VVEQLNAKNLRTIAMGDSSLDLKMLRKAKEGIVVVGEPSSGSMKGAVEGALEERKFTAKQVLLPPTARPLLDSKRLPIVSLTGKEFIASLFAFKQPEDGTQSQSFTGIPSITVIDTTEEPAAKVLTAPTRNNNISGPALRETHRKIGHHLAIQEVTKVIGLETYKIPHVQGGTTPGHRLLHEEQTLIVALMRGGEPMAFGVNDAFPSAMFLHADPPEDIKPEHLKGVITIILVDSVINDGNTIVKFVKAIRRQHATIRIVVVSGVTQRNAVKEECLIAQKLTREEAIGLKIVTLRISDNKFKGVGGIDTGNRLFNTTHWQ
jgi:uracil phosphoribosyltransferase